MKTQSKIPKSTRISSNSPNVKKSKSPNQGQEKSFSKNSGAGKQKKKNKNSISSIFDNIQELQIDDYKKDKEQTKPAQSNSSKEVSKPLNVIKKNLSTRLKESATQENVNIDAGENMVSHNTSSDGTNMYVRHASIVTFGNKSDQESKFEKNEIGGMGNILFGDLKVPSPKPAEKIR